MTETALTIATYGLMGIIPLLTDDELQTVVLELDSRRVVIELTLIPRASYTVVFDREVEADRYDAVVHAFDWVQDYLAENWVSRAEARPRCLPGHLHPAMCRRQADTVVLICPKSFDIVLRIA
jgi:hypothetical protein